MLEQIEKENYILICSEALVYENNQNPDSLRRERISTYFELAKDFIKLEESDFNRARFLNEIGFPDMDALHIAIAEKGGIDFFVTCDDRIVHHYKENIQAVRVSIINLLEFVLKEVK